MGLHSTYFSSALVQFCAFFLFLEKVCSFSSTFLYVHIRTSQTVRYSTNFSEKYFFEEVQRYFEISLLSFIHKTFEQNFYQYVTLYLVRIWACKNVDEKVHTFSWEKQKRKKNRQNEQKSDTE